MRTKSHYIVANSYENQYIVKSPTGNYVYSEDGLPAVFASGKRADQVRRSLQGSDPLGKIIKITYKDYVRYD